MRVNDAAIPVTPNGNPMQRNRSGISTKSLMHLLVHQALVILVRKDTEREGYQWRHVRSAGITGS
jgi:hypothetical protein